MEALFPDRTWTLHLFSGELHAKENEVTFDIFPRDGVSVVGDVRNLPFACDSFDFVLADPPYSQADADHYMTRMINRGKTMRDLRGVVCAGGVVAWLDTVRPMYSSKLWRQRGAIAVLVSTNTHVRCLSLFEAV